MGLVKTVRVRALIALIITPTLASYANAAPSLQFDGGLISGINDIECTYGGGCDGATWNATFLSGTWEFANASTPDYLAYGEQAFPLTLNLQDVFANNPLLMAEYLAADGIAGCTVTPSYCQLMTTENESNKFGVTDGYLVEVSPYGFNARLTAVSPSIDYGSVTYVSWKLSSVPIPAAVWLFCSGLIGLVGFARRKRI